MTPLPWAIDSEIAMTTESYFRNLQNNFSKAEKVERAQSREKKEGNVLSNKEILQILKSKQVGGHIETAERSLDEELYRCSSIMEFVSLRNAIITSLMIRSVRRSQEFAVITIGEFKSLKKLKDTGDG